MHKKRIKSKTIIKFIRLMLLLLIGFQTIHPLHTAASHVIEKRDFDLTAENKWEAKQQVNYAELQWDKVENLASKGYTLYQSKDGGTTWEAVSTNYRKMIRVLNVYPDSEISNSLKGWMDDLGLKDGEGNLLIQVTPVSITQFNENPNLYLKDSAGDYQYDVMMFGSLDGYNAKDLTEKSYAATRAFSDEGRGILFGHDTLYYAHPQFMKYADDLGITKTRAIIGELVGHNQVRVIDNGYLMKYPFELKNNMVLDIPYAHIMQQKLKASPSKIWLNFTGSSGMYPNPIVDNETLTNNWYLLTNQNIAMIQTGHSNGQSTLDERKIIANTLYNLAQVSQDNFADDFTVKDTKAPDKPTVSFVTGNPLEKLELILTANDKGTPY